MDNIVVLTAINGDVVELLRRISHKTPSIHGATFSSRHTAVHLRSCVIQTRLTPAALDDGAPALRQCVDPQHRASFLRSDGKALSVDSVGRQIRHHPADTIAEQRDIVYPGAWAACEVVVGGVECLVKEAVVIEAEEAAVKV